MFNKIQNPETGNWVNIQGIVGRRVLRNYVRQMGGDGGGAGAAPPPPPPGAGAAPRKTKRPRLQLDVISGGVGASAGDKHGAGRSDLPPFWDQIAWETAERRKEEKATEKAVGASEEARAKLNVTKIGEGGFGKVYKVKGQFRQGTMGSSIILIPTESLPLQLAFKYISLYNPTIIGSAGFAKNWPPIGFEFLDKSHEDIIKHLRYFYSTINLLKLKIPELIHTYSVSYIPCEPSHYIGIFSEFVEGKELLEILKQYKADPSNQARYILHVIELLQQLKDHGIYHNDFKLNNIMVKNTDPLGIQLLIIDYDLVTLGMPRDQFLNLQPCPVDAAPPNPPYPLRDCIYFLKGCYCNIDNSYLAGVIYNFIEKFKSQDIFEEARFMDNPSGFASAQAPELPVRVNRGPRQSIYLNNKSIEGGGCSDDEVYKELVILQEILMTAVADLAQ
jgi:serine/threonine protein kinase